MDNYCLILSPATPIPTVLTHTGNDKMGIQSDRFIKKYEQMKTIIIGCAFALGFISQSLSAFSQCEILHRLYPDGSMFYYIEPVNFYWTKSKELKGGIETDLENYFLELQPSPFPEKPEGRKLKDDLELRLSNDSIYHLEHFDTRYLDHDTVMQLLYLIDKKNMDVFLNFDVVSVKINLLDSAGIRTYVFKLHKSAIREQLTCLLKEKGKIK
jgi:hypothetical protein